MRKTLFWTLSISLVTILGACSTEKTNYTSYINRSPINGGLNDADNNDEITNIYVNYNLDVWTATEAKALLSNKFLCSDPVIQQQMADASVDALLSEYVLCEIELFYLNSTSLTDTSDVVLNSPLGVSEVFLYVINMPNNTGFGIVPGDKRLSSLISFYNNGHLDVGSFSQSTLCQNHTSGMLDVSTLASNTSVYYSPYTINFSIEQIRNTYYEIAQTTHFIGACSLFYITNTYSPFPCTYKSLLNEQMFIDNSVSYHIYDLNQTDYFLAPPTATYASHTGSIPLEMFKLCQIYEIEDFVAEDYEESRSMILALGELANADYSQIYPTCAIADYQVAMQSLGFSVDTTILSGSDYKLIIDKIKTAFAQCRLVWAHRDNEVYQIVYVNEWQNNCGQYQYSIILRANKDDSDNIDEVIISDYHELLKYRIEIYSCVECAG